MVNQLLLTYIRQQFGAGVSREALLKTLAAAGWAKQDIDDTIAAVPGAPAAPATPITPRPSTPATSSIPTTPSASSIPVAQTMAQAVAQQTMTPTTPVTEKRPEPVQPAANTPVRTFSGKPDAAPAGSYSVPAHSSPVHSPIQQTQASINVAARKPAEPQSADANPAHKRKWPLVLGIIIFLIVLVGAGAVFLWPMLQSILTGTNPTPTATTTEATAPALPAATSTGQTATNTANGFSIASFNLPVPARVAGGTKNVVMGDVLFRAVQEPASLQSVDMVLSSGKPADIARVTLWNGNTLLATSTFTASSSVSSFALSAPIQLEQNGEIQLTLKADLSAVGSTAGTDGDSVLVEVAGAEGAGKTSGQAISGKNNVSAVGTRGVVLSSNASIAATPSITDISPTTLRAGESTQVTITGSGFTASSTVLLFGYNSPVKPDSVSPGRTKLTFTFPADYPAGAQSGNALSISVPVIVSNTDAASFESGFTSNRAYFTLVP